MLHSVWHTLLPIQAWACWCLRVVNADKFIEATSDQSIPIFKISLTNLPTSPPTQPTTNASFTCQHHHLKLNQLLEWHHNCLHAEMLFSVSSPWWGNWRVLKKHRIEFMQNSFKLLDSQTWRCGSNMSCTGIRWPAWTGCSLKAGRKRIWERYERSADRCQCRIGLGNTAGDRERSIVTPDQKFYAKILSRVSRLLTSHHASN